uniref:Uncharacterized protein n=1 Tax=Romanomermis culicivorax TaxID=13658 RepID=A0A915J036_ROMCU
MNLVLDDQILDYSILLTDRLTFYQAQDERGRSYDIGQGFRKFFNFVDFQTFIAANDVIPCFVDFLLELTEKSLLLSLASSRPVPKDDDDDGGPKISRRKFSKSLCKLSPKPLDGIKAMCTNVDRSANCFSIPITRALKYGKMSVFANLLQLL